MSRKVPLAEVAPLAEGELLKLGRCCNALVLKIQRVLAQAGQEWTGAACVAQVLSTAKSMSDAFDDFLAKRNYSSDAVRAPSDALGGAAPPDGPLDGAIAAAGNGEEAPGEFESPSAREREFYGHSDVVPLSEVLDFVGFTRKTGTLRIFAVEETLVVEFEEGEVVGACSDRPPLGTRVGELLVAHQAIGSEALEAFLASTGERRSRLGEALVQAGLVTTEDLLEALAEQVQGIFNRLVAMENVEFFFRARPMDGGAERRSLRLNPTQLLLEGARARDAAIVHG
ncbi:MAG: DUF4388 domain-containing protein [Planctomycetes bacterium]|nr:DUF4388 domain-containing protein [Planctomycetota bacterium]